MIQLVQPGQARALSNNQQRGEIKMNNKFLKQLLRPLLSILAIIIICAFLVRYLTDSETLSDYAAKNPDLAYGDSSSHIDEGKDIEGSVNNNMNDQETTNKDIDNNTDNNSQTDNTTDDWIINSEKNVANNDDGEINSSKPQTDYTKNVANSSSNNRTTYKDGFYYEDLSEDIRKKITGISYPVSKSEAEAQTAEKGVEVFNILEDDDAPAITYDDLCLLNVLYYDFNGEAQSGELICNKKIADDLAEIFYELYINEYQIEKIRLVDEYNADDTASMADNNTSCFNYRVVDDTTTLSKHALGCAIDINPFYNPYIIYNKNGSGETYISPKGSEVYADRSKDFPYKIDENDLCYKLFKAHGFTWGGDWNSCKDYQHFQKTVD